MVARWSVALLLCAGIAFAVPTHEEARRRADAARALFQAGRFADAALEFQAAYEIAPEPQLLYNLGICYEEAGMADRAAEALQRYLNTTPGAADRAAVEQEIARLKGAAPLAPPEAHVERPLRDLPPAAPPPRRYLATGILFGAGALALGASIVTGVVADQTYQHAMESCVDRTCLSSVASDAQHFSQLKIVSAVTLAVGAAALAAAVVALVLEHRAARPRAVAWTSW